MAEALPLPIEGYEAPVTTAMGDYALPVAAPIPASIPRVVINTAPEEEKLIKHESGKTLKEVKHNPFEKLLGINGAERYQLWPEKLIRSGITAAGDALAGKIPQYEVDPTTGEVHTSPQMIERAMDMSAVAGTGGLAGTGEGAGVALGATPFLRPALKHKDRLYKGKVGQEHQDIIPNELYNDFQKKAMSGEDLAEYNFGFVNDKGQFLTREKALQYGIDTGLIDPHAGKYGALTSTLLADSSKPGTAIEAMAKTQAPTFYSAVEHQVSQIPQAKMTGDQWLGTLSNKPGVKPEELDWTGLKSFLEENKGQPVTKAQIEEHLAANKVELKEVQKGGNNDPYLAYMRDSRIAHELKTPEDIDLAKKHNANFRESFKGMSDREILKLAREAEATKDVGPTKYHSYQLPGGENYREMLLTMPKAKTVDQIATEKGYGGWHSGLTKAQQEEVLTAHSNQKIPSNYSSSHWDEPNILAHVRMNNRTIEGKKSLHLEEIQSDWHQQGRDKGYSNPAEIEKKQNDLKAEIDKVVTERAKLAGAKTPEDRAKYQAAHEKEVSLIDEYNKLHDMKAYGVPDAPFKKTWHELALKRMIKEAAEKGYDRLSWTPGEAQAARYDLSKQVDKIAVPMVSNSGYSRSVRIDGKDGTSYKLMVNADGKVEGQLSAGQFTGKLLSDVVGKEMADKIMKLQAPHEFAGEGLKIGGEGMKGFYDQIIPKALEKIGKEHGVKVKQVDISGRNTKNLETVHTSPKELYDASSELQQKYAKISDFVDHYNNLNTEQRAELIAKVRKQGNQPVHYIDIPQSLKNHALHKGFPLFSKGVPLPLMPVEGDPFNASKEK